MVFCFVFERCRARMSVRRLASPTKGFHRLLQSLHMILLSRQLKCVFPPYHYLNNFTDADFQRLCLKKNEFLCLINLSYFATDIQSVLALSPSVTPDQILAAIRHLRGLISWGVFPDGSTGLSSLLDPLLASSSLDPLWSLLHLTLN
jgi:hypothetical protein